MVYSNTEVGAGMVRGVRRFGLCEVCRRWSDDAAPSAALCSDCLATYAAAACRCARCGLRTGQPLAACGACLHEPPPWRSCCCSVDYGFPWQTLLGAFKYQGQAALAAPLAALMLRGPRPAAQALLPLPLADDRLAQRGYNQAWELARRLGRVCGLPARADVLLRPLPAAQAQAELSRAQRLRNLRGSFMVAPQARGWLQGRAVALVDDVMTTGATAHEASTTLLQAGAASVDIWVLARTPAPGSPD